MSTNKQGPYTTEGGEHLWEIAAKVYGLSSEWRRIRDANADLIEDAADALEAGLVLTIPALEGMRQLSEEAQGKNHLLVHADIAHLEGRKLLQEPVQKLNGVSGESARLLEKLGVLSIFDLALSRVFNGVRELVEGSGVLATEYTKHNFIPGDLFRGDPKTVPSLGAFLGARLEELEFQQGSARANLDYALELKEALPAESVRDLALWPPFRGARTILEGTFNPYGIVDDDPEAPSDLLPKSGNFATERIQYESVVLGDISTPGEATRDLETSGPVGLLSGVVDAAGATGPAEGAILTTEQAWYAQGVTLGQLLHSVALGPGESTRIAMVDWTRRTSGSTSSSTRQLDRLAQSSAQARSISEITNAIALESQHGSSRASHSNSSRSGSSTRSAGGGGSFLGFGGSASTSSNSAFAINHGVATSVSRSRGDRRLSAHTAQGVSARTRQHATASRSRRATIVQETFEKESETATTRVITNYNHMHAMSLQYYEVVQAYRVRTQVIDYDRVLFVPMQTVNFSDPNSIEKYRSVLWTYAAFVDWKPGKAALEEIKSALDSDTLDSVPASEGDDEIRAQAERRPNTWQQLIAAWKRPTFHSRLRLGSGTRSTHVTDLEPKPLSPGLTDGRLVRIDYGPTELSGDEGTEILGLEISSRIGTSKRVYRFEGHQRGEGRVEFSNLRLEDIDEVRVLFPGRVDRRRPIELQLSVSGYDDLVQGTATLHHDIPVKLRVTAPIEPDLMEVGQRLSLEQRVKLQADRLQGAGLGQNTLEALMELSPDGLAVLKSAVELRPRLDSTRAEIARLVDFYGAQAELAREMLDAVRGEGNDLLGELARAINNHAARGDDESPETREALAALLGRIDVDQEAEEWVLKLSDASPLMRAMYVSSDVRSVEVALEEALSRFEAHSVNPKLLDDLMRVRFIVTGGEVEENGEFLAPTTLSVLTELESLRENRATLAADEALRTQEREPRIQTAFSVEAQTTSKVIDDRVRDWLLRHLNEHALFYSQAIWLETDPMELSRCLVDLEYRGERIMHTIDPKPVVVTGNYLGFRWMFTTAEEKQTWMDTQGYSLSDVNAEDTMVPLPTGGVFAEAVLGRFNAAEKLDLTRFWDWKESPIPIVPPGINPIDMASPSAGPGAPSTDSLAAPGVRIQPPSELPNPTGMAAAMQGITAANMFRDMSGMEHTATLAEAAAKMASAQAVRATELSGEGAQHAAEQATRAMELGMEHQRKMAELALEAAPMLAAPMTGGASLAATGPSKAGALMNMAQKLDAGGGGDGDGASGSSSSATKSAFSSLIGKVGGLLMKSKK